MNSYINLQIIYIHFRRILNSLVAKSVCLSKVLGTYKFRSLFIENFIDNFYNRMYFIII